MTPRQRDHSLQVCSKGHTVDVCKIRYREGGTHRTALPRGAAARLSGLSPPSHIPTDHIGGPGPPAGARGPLFIFRKIHLYGKSKKSTHGHTTQTPTCTNFQSTACARPRQRTRARLQRLHEQQQRTPHALMAPARATTGHPHAATAPARATTAHPHALMAPAHTPTAPARATTARPRALVAPARTATACATGYRLGA
jgi:hypothetical protein